LTDYWITQILNAGMILEEEQYKYSDITGKIIGCAMKVHTFLGNGFQEVIYQRALAYEFAQSNLNFARELEVDIFYRDKPEPIGTRRVDFLVEDKVLIELKATSQLEENHYAQVLNYLTAYKLEIALLINFGEKSLKFKRLIKSQENKSVKSQNQQNQ
jgi:GxxExxY protein